jgi:hypothetical protein
MRAGGRAIVNKPMTKSDAFQWRAVEAPVVRIRRGGGDGLVIEIRTMTMPEPEYGGAHAAMGDVITVNDGVEERHTNVLMFTDEPRKLAGRLEEALNSPLGHDLTAVMFDDGMTLRIEHVGPGSWTLLCRPVPLPGPSDTWKTFPEFSFSLAAVEIQEAIADLQRLSAVLTPSWDGAEASAWTRVLGRSRTTATARWFFKTLLKGLALVFAGLVVVFVAIFLVTVLFGGGFGDR